MKSFIGRVENLAISKSVLAAEIKHLLETDLYDGGLAGSYGYGEFMETMIIELIPYLNREGLLLFKKELESAFEEELKTGETLI